MILVALLACMAVATAIALGGALVVTRAIVAEGRRVDKSIKRLAERRAAAKFTPASLVQLRAAGQTKRNPPQQALPRCREATEAARRALQVYGCGACGPRGFYGTTDAHLALERELAAFFQCEAAALYSSAYLAVTGTVAALLTMPEYASMLSVPLDHGCAALDDACALAPRSTRVMRRHDHMVAVNRGVIVAVSDKQAPLGLECARVRIVFDRFDMHGLEGMFDLCVGSLAPLGCVGGFVVGERRLVEAQRLAAPGYVFSAALPAYLVEGARAAIRQRMKS